MNNLISPILNWLDGIFRGIPLDFLEIFGRLGLLIGVLLATLVYGRFTFRCGDRWAVGRERQEWNTKAMLSFVLTMVLIIGSGMIGSRIVIVPGAQTLESLKDMSVFICVLVFGFPALLAITPAYMLSDMIEGLPPSWVLIYTPAYLTIAGYHWVGYQLFGKDPDFRKPPVWARYGLFVAFFLPVYSAYFGYVCGPMSGNFPKEISYRVITPALFATLVGTWIMAPFGMLGALPLARKLGLFWAEIPGHVRERRFGSKTWEWVSGPSEAHPATVPRAQRVPFHLLVAVPSVGLVLAMVALVAFIAMRSGETSGNRLAERLHREIADNLQMQVHDALAVPGLGPPPEAVSLDPLLHASRIAKDGRAFILDLDGQLMASSKTVPPGEPDLIVDAALDGLHRQQSGGATRVTEPRIFRFDLVTASPLSRETWLAQVSPCHGQGGVPIGQLVTALPESNFLGEIQAGNTRVAIIITLALTLALVVAMLLAGALAHPLRRLAQSANVLAQGDLAQRVPSSWLAEVDTLAGAFNHMGDRLQDSFAKTRAGEEKLRTVLHTSPLPISWVNQAGVIEFWNRKALELFGYDPQEIDTAEKWFQLAYPDPEYRKEVINQWNASVASGPDGNIHRGEYDITCKNGRVVTTEILGTRCGDLTLAIFNDLTERKQAQRELTLVSERLQVATRASGIGVWDWDVVKNELVWDDAMYRLYGIGGEDFSGAYEAWSQSLHPEDKPRIEAAIQAALRGEREYSEEFRIIQPDGAVRVLQAGSQAFHDASGKPLRMVGVNYDITERKLIQEELRQHRDHMEELVAARTAELGEANTSLENTVHEFALSRYMLDKVTTAIYLIDRSGRFIYVNECAAQYSGYTCTELLGMSTFDLNPEQPPESWTERWETVHALPEGELNTTKILQRRKDGSTFPMEILAHHMSHEGCDYQLSVGLDITERERAEEDMLRINAVSDQALELTRSGYWTVPLDGSPDYISSERAATIFGDPPNPEWQYTVQHWLDCIEAVDPDICAETARKFFAACAGETPDYNAVYPYKRPRDGRVVWLHGLGTIIRRANRPPQMFGVVQDITEIVENRRELEEARKAAELANRLKSEFLANMSHEIRTPMNGVLGMAELLSLTPLEAGQREQLAMLRGSGEDLLRIINDILDFSKIEAGRMELETIGFSLHDMVSRTLHSLASQAAAKNLEIELAIPDGLPDLRLGDPNRLRQVLTNLVGNAIKFTERGWVRVVVMQGPGPHGLRVEVTDTGEGMSREAQAKLFHPFSQADASTTRKHGGTGLGLVISARIIEQMAGSTGVTSVPGCGSTFWFELSLPPAAPEQVASPANRMPGALTMLAGKRVLLVDDNAINRSVAGTLMRRWGMTVSEAADGPTALAQVRTVSRLDDAGYDVAVLVGAMPGMDGWELASAIREIPGCAVLPLIMASSSGLVPARSSGENRLFRRFLIKPVRPAQLAGALAEVLTGWQPGPAAPISPAPPAPIPIASRGARVLLVEDTQVNQIVARAMLEEGGHQVTLAGNGVEALAQLEQPDLFDIILMDCQMPAMDGFEATRQLRLRERKRGWKPYRVVAMTANAMQSDKDACLDAGMDGYLPKPVRMEELLKMVTGK